MTAKNYVELVRISRKDALEPMICCVHQSTNACVIASELSESLDLDGLCLLPTKTIQCFDRDFERCEFYRAALDTWSEPNQLAGHLSELTCNMQDDLRLFARRKDVVAVHMELTDADVCYVGVVRDIADTSMVLKRISSAGEFLSEPFSIEIASITKIEVATRYLTAVGHAAHVLAGQVQLSARGLE